MRYRELLICLSFLVLEVSLQAANFANELAKCIDIKDIDECLIETMNELRKLMKVGIPELGLRRSEPFEIDNLEFNSDPGPVDVRAKFNNVVVRGLSKFQTNYIKADLLGQSLSLGLTVPRMDITGNYEVDGQVIIFRVNGAGNFISALHDVTGNGKANIVPVGTGTEQRLGIRNIDFDFSVGRAQVRMNNLFNGELPSLARRVNSWISDNSDLIINAVKPQIKREVTVIVERVLNDAFSKVPAQSFIENLHRKAASEGKSPSSPSTSARNLPPPPPGRVVQNIPSRSFPPPPHNIRGSRRFVKFA